MTPARRARSKLILVAPILSEAMGGEAMKALNICRELVAKGYDVHQVTHDRSRPVISRYLPDLAVTYIRDYWFQKLAWRLFGSGYVVGLLDCWLLNREARRLARRHHPALVHFTSPISTVLPYFSFPEAPTVIGPLNGDIFYPAGFEHRLGGVARIRRRVQPLAQYVLGLMFRGKRKAAALLVAGGDRTRRALARGGAREERMIDTLDSGVPNDLLNMKRLTHEGRHGRFVFLGRLVDFKGCDLLMHAVARTESWISLDIIGEGEQGERLASLIEELGLQERVFLRGWMTTGQSLFETLRHYRGMGLVSLAEANGIVVQEAMMLGLPVLALDWGGPSLLLQDGAGVLIPVGSRDEVIDGFAKALTRIAEDEAHAEAVSRRARERAETEHFAWRDLIDDWAEIYARVLNRHGLPPLERAQTRAVELGTEPATPLRRGKAS